MSSIHSILRRVKRLTGRAVAFALLGAALALPTLAVAGCGGDDDADSAAYATVRRYEGVTDPAEAGRQVAAASCRL